MGPLLRTALKIVGGIVFLAVAVLLLPIGHKRAPSDMKALAETAKINQQDTPKMTPADMDALNKRWTNAPSEIRELARIIAQGELPNRAVLNDVGADALSMGYRSPDLDFTWSGRTVPFQATLLKEAVQAYNLEATLALLEAGADPNEDHGEALFIAVQQRTRGSPPNMIFNDFEEMIPFIDAYLDHGVDPNQRRYGFQDRTPFDFASGEMNLSGMLALLQGGANPWLELENSRGSTRMSPIEDLAFGAGADPAAELLFRILRSGKLPPGPQVIQEKILEQLDDVAESFALGDGPDARRTAWRLDQILQLVGPAFEMPDKAAAIRDKLTRFDYTADGGWRLAENETHSRYEDAGFSIPEHGSEIWGP